MLSLTMEHDHCSFIILAPAIVNPLNQLQLKNIEIQGFVSQLGTVVSQLGGFVSQLEGFVSQLESLLRN